jgi:ech hydrogenase subunit D
MEERKDLIQDISPIATSDLLETVSNIKSAGYRLGQACATKLDDSIEVMYSFEKDNLLKNYVVSIPDTSPELQSITAIFWPAFIYENEMHDLFGIRFLNLALDYEGHFFKLAGKTPWNPNAEKAAPPAEHKAAEADAVTAEAEDVTAEAEKGDGE